MCLQQKRRNREARNQHKLSHQTLIVSRGNIPQCSITPAQAPASAWILGSLLGSLYVSSSSMKNSIPPTKNPLRATHKKLCVGAFLPFFLAGSEERRNSKKKRMTSRREEAGTPYNWAKERQTQEAICKLLACSTFSTVVTF